MSWINAKKKDDQIARLRRRSFAGDARVVWIE
jgi:hypothetical protein